MATTLYHPTLPDVTVEVEDNVEAWAKQGWKKSEPKAAREAREAQTASE